jgi:hypothetical protein
MSRSRIRVASLIVLISTILFSSLRSLVSVSNLAVLHLFHLLSEMLSLLASFSSSYVCWLAVFVSFPTTRILNAALMILLHTVGFE